jgi:hypothetical protein
MMPTLPNITVTGLKHVTPGSLVSLKNNAGKLVFGLCVTTTGEPEDPTEPALVVLSPAEAGIVATAIPNRGSGNGWMVNGNTRVIDHGRGYSIHVHAKDWYGELKEHTFAPSDAGLLLLGERDGLNLAVSVPYTGGCDLLNLKTWKLAKAGIGLHVAAKTWRLSLPWTSGDVEWPLEVRSHVTPEEFIAATKK